MSKDILGKKMKTSTSDEIGTVTDVIGNVALVKYGDIKRKVMVTDLEDADQVFTKQEYEDAYTSTLNYELLEELYETPLDELSANEMLWLVASVFERHMFKLFGDPLEY